MHQSSVNMGGGGGGGLMNLCCVSNMEPPFDDCYVIVDGNFTSWRALPSLITSSCVNACFHICFSGEGSRHSDNSEDRNPAVMARAVTAHPDTIKVMYFA